jgi:tetratricopeptide (TPR) repeat protein
MSQAERDAGERAEVLLELGRPADAEAHVRRALSDDPNDPDLLVLSSRVMLALERFEDARDHAKSALAADPEAVIAHSCLAAALSGLKDYDAALKVVRRAVVRRPAPPARRDLPGLRAVEGGTSRGQESLEVESAGFGVRRRARSRAVRQPTIRRRG